MKCEPIFPILVGKAQLEFDQNMINVWKNYIRTTEKATLSHEHINPSARPTQDYLTINERLLDSFIFGQLKEEITSQARLYATESNIPFEDLQICNSWGYQIGLDNNPVNYHSHANSMISGVYYLTEGAPIEFRSHHFPVKNSPFAIEPLYAPKPEKFIHQIFPKENLLIFFPSSLEHRVLKNFIDERYCIAFNIIPKGDFGVPYGNFTL